MKSSPVSSFLALLCLVCEAGAFQLYQTTISSHQLTRASLSDSVGCRSNTGPFSVCLRQSRSEDVDSDDSLRLRNSRVRRVFRKIQSKLKKPILFVAPIVVALSTVAAVPPKANAGAPVMAMPKTKAQDPVQNAFDLHERKMMAEAQEELSAFQAKAKQIEREKGPEARDQFENEYKEAQKEKAASWMKGLEQLKRELLDQGIDPDLDIEGRRQIIQYEKGVDLGKVGGTIFNVEKTYESKSPERSFGFKKKYNREMIKCMVQDLKNRDIDPLQYFSRNHEKTQMILDLPAAKAEILAAQYQNNLDLYGQVAVPKEGEISAKEMMNKKGRSRTSKVDQKRLNEEAKAQAATERAEAKARAKKEKEIIKKEKRMAKEEAQRDLEVSKALSTEAITNTATDSEANLAPSSDSDNEIAEAFDENDDDNGGTAVSAIGMSSSTTKTSESDGIKIIPAAGVVAVATGAYLVKTMRDRSAAKEAERQRQFRLLMGEGENGKIAPAKRKSDHDKSSVMTLKHEEKVDRKNDVLSPIDAAPERKRRGLKSVFGKKKNGRERDITVLVSGDAKAPEFAKTLAKILTFGAPGRFPEVSALPGDVPLDVFDEEKACAILVAAQEEAGLTREATAEIFANVVNCMLIDIVDLASSSLKEKDDNATVNALVIVIEFMDLASQLFAAIADGVTIAPVTYGGDTSKAKLEQMYCAYAASGMTDMMNLDEKFDARLVLLRDVFQIPEKKAESLAMKVAQKSMMEMMTSGKIPDVVDEMVKGMEGMGMDGEAPDAEQLKETLRSLTMMKESGSIPESEMENLNKHFQEDFGSSIDELLQKVEQDGGLAEADEELLDLVKALLK